MPPEHTKLEQIRQLAECLVNEHLPGWQFAFNRQRRTLGVCRFREKRIELSKHHAFAGTLEQARATVLHEIAHGLAGPRTAHGPKWRHWMHHLGETPEVTARTDYSLNDYRWALVRKQGDSLRFLAGRYRKPKRTDHLVVRGDPGSLGKVYFCSYEDYREWETGRRCLHEIRLRQS